MAKILDTSRMCTALIRLFASSVAELSRMRIGSGRHYLIGGGRHAWATNELPDLLIHLYLADPTII